MGVGDGKRVNKGGFNVNINEVRWLRAIGSEPWNRLFTKHLLSPWINQLRKQTQSRGVSIAWLYLDVRLLRPLTNGFFSSSMFGGLFGFPSTSGDVIDWHDKKIKIITVAKASPFCVDFPLETEIFVLSGAREGRKFESSLLYECFGLCEKSKEPTMQEIYFSNKRFLLRSWKGVS